MKKLTRTLKSIGAVLLALALAITPMPGKTADVKAAEVENFTIKLENYNGTGKVKLTRQESASQQEDETVAEGEETTTAPAEKEKEMQKNLTAGEAVFDNSFVDTDDKFDMEITNLNGYKNISKKDLKFTGESYTVTGLQKQITISGKVTDKNNDAVDGVTVKYASHDEEVKGTTTTNSEGKYSFTAFENDYFDVEFSIDNNKYGKQTIQKKDQKFDDDKDDLDVQFDKFNSFDMTNKVPGAHCKVSVNGKTLGTDDSESVEYNQDATILISPAKGYDFEKLVLSEVDGSDTITVLKSDMTQKDGKYQFEHTKTEVKTAYNISLEGLKKKDEKIIYSKSTYKGELPAENGIYYYSETTDYKSGEKYTRSGSGTIEVSLSVTDEKTYYVYYQKTATSHAQLIDILEFKLDNTAPTVSHFDVMKTLDLQKLYDKQFGFFYNNIVTIEVTVLDAPGQGETDSSGTAKTYLFANGFDADGNLIKDSDIDPVEGTLTSSNKDADNVTTSVYTFKVPANTVLDEDYYLKRIIKATAIDSVGNGMSTAQKCTSDISNIKQENLMIENTEPSFTYEYSSGGVIHYPGEQDWFDGDTDITITAQDPSKTGTEGGDDLSGINEVEVLDLNNDSAPVTINEGSQKYYAVDGSEIDNDGTKKVQKMELTVNTANAQINDEGGYRLKVVITDNAGNTNTKDNVIISFKDEEAPFVNKMTFSSAEKGYKGDEGPKDEVSAEGDKEFYADNIERDPKYGYYFKAKTRVTIHAQDNAPSSGLKSITYYKKPYNGDPEDSVTEPIELDKKTDNKKGTISFDVEENFKGEIFAVATDNVENTSPHFVTPDGTIIEKKTKHEEQKAPHIRFIPKSTNYRDADGNYLYSNDTTVAVEVVDDYSGIRDVEWWIKSDVNDLGQSGKVTVYNDKTQKVENKGKTCTGDWQATTEGKSNLVTKLTNNFKLTNNSNNIRITVKLTDRAGNTSDEVGKGKNSSYKTFTLSIDKTDPKLVVKMNENDDSQFAGFFKNNRKYDIYLYERNLNKKSTKMKSKREDDYGDNHTKYLSTNFKKIGKTMLDGAQVYVYKKSGTFKAEGDYSFTINTKDLANNSTPNDKVKYSKEIKSKKKKTNKNTQQGTTQANNKVNSDDSKILDYKKQNNKDKGIDTKFTIDKTTPKVTVTYDNNNAVNGKYFPQARTATIKIKEHNFTKEHNRIRINKKATKDGSSIGGATMSSWAHKIDTNIYKATIPYTQDGDYQFGIDVTDKAGNKVSDSGVNYPNGRDLSKDFVIDQSVEKPIIGGVENGKSYPEKCIPTIQVNDTNYESSEVKLLRTQKDDIDRDVTSKYIKSMPANGSTVSEDYFDKLKANDGIYKLSVNITDMAGNTDSEEVAFTVNRFGSVYEFSKDLVDLQNNYVKKVDGNIFIREFNPDRLVEDSVELEVQRDQDPVENVKYDVSPEVNKKVDIGSSGWYQYKYDIGNNNFKRKGVYTVNVKTKDDAGNTPESNNQSEIRFSVDPEKPDIVNVKGLENSSVNAKEQKVDYLIHDSFGLKSIVATVDGKEVANITEFANPTNYEGNFVIKEGYQRKVNFKITDLAGNVTNTADTDFNPEYDFNSTITVSTNIFLLWFANKWLFFGSLIGLAAIAVAIAYLIRRKIAGKLV